MNLRSYLSQQGVTAAPTSHRHARSGWVNIDCPWCGPGSRKFHLGIREGSHKTACWKCGPHRLVAALAMATGRPESDFYHLDQEARRGPIRREEAPKRCGRLKLPPGLGDLLPAHRKYLKRRGFDPDELVELWGLKGVDMTPPYAWRIWIPIRVGAEVVSWTTRSVSDNAERRYINAPPDMEAIPAKECLYGAENARHAVCVVEGPFDVWKIGPGAVCTLGVQFSAAQVEAIASYPERGICYDAEPRAQKRALQLIDKLKPFPGSTTNIELDAKDPGEAEPWEIEIVKKTLGI